MNLNIGGRETRSALIIFSLCFPFLFFSGLSVQKLGSGAWLNAVICSVLNYIMMLIACFYFKTFGKQNIIYSAYDTAGKIFSLLVGISLFVVLFLYVSTIFEAVCLKIVTLENRKINAEYIRVLILLSSVICAVLGIEAITRFSYITILFLALTIIALVLITLKGASIDNLFPLMGNKAKETVTPSYHFSLFGGILPVFVISDYFKEKNDMLSCVKKTVVIVCIVAVFIVLWFVLCVPFTVGGRFGTGVEAIFSSASSGSVLRRFDLLLILVYVVGGIVAMSFGLFCLARTLCFVCDIDDNKPFIWISGMLMFYFGKLFDFENQSISISVISTISAFVMPLVVTFFKKLKKVN